jgi:hypothetical protein
MKLAENYSLSVGLKLSEPYLYEKFIPNPYEDYILVHAGGGNGNFTSKLWDYWQEAISLIRDALPSHYKIIQIGTNNDPLFRGVDLDLRDKTTIHQSHYLIRRCLLFLGNDSICSHIAGWCKKPMVSVYGGTSVANHSPYFYAKDKSVFLEPDRKRVCSFSFQEDPKTINFIKPEQVVIATLKLLDLKWNSPIETVYIGTQYKQDVIETIPNQVINPNFFNGILNIRADYYFNEPNIFNQISQCKCVVVTPQALDIKILTQLKQNIVGIGLKVDAFPNVVEYVNLLQKNLIPYSLITDSEDEDEIKQKKTLLFEYGIVVRI